MKSNKGLLLAAAAVLAALVVAGVNWLIGGGGPSGFQGYELKPPGEASDFTLTTQNGEQYHFSGAHAEASLMFFGYTFCPDVCPSTMAEFRQVIKELGQDANRVQFVFVSVDPGRDTPARLKEYLSRFHFGIVGLTGTEAEVAKVVKAYNIVAEKETVSGSQASYLISHTASAFLIDKKGQIRVKFPFGTTPEVMLNDVRYLLSAKGR